jgi:hypothetical protein
MAYFRQCFAVCSSFREGQYFQHQGRHPSASYQTDFFRENAPFAPTDHLNAEGPKPQKMGETVEEAFPNPLASKSYALRNRVQPFP